MILACRARISIIVAAADERERASMSGMHGSVRRRDLPRRARASASAAAGPTPLSSRRWCGGVDWMDGWNPRQTGGGRVAAAAAAASLMFSPPPQW